MKVKGYAKINLFFQICGLKKLESDFSHSQKTREMHQISTIFYALDLADELTFSITEAEQFLCECKMAGVEEKGNLAYKAAQFFSDQMINNKPFHVSINIEKNIPIAAGLAGGSADCAATLYGLNQLTKKYSESELYAVAAMLGADVSFSLLTIIRRERGQKNVVAIGSNFGEVLEEIETNLSLDVNLVTSDFGICTKESYEQWDLLNSDKIHNYCVNQIEDNKFDQLHSSQQRIRDMIDALKMGDFTRLTDLGFYNDLEEVALVLKPQLRDLLNKSRQNGFPSFITGSGPTIIEVRGAQNV
jgi:4-diphosphocytidyl-2-C-methyl-D-erythritol kinase